MENSLKEFLKRMMMCVFAPFRLVLRGRLAANGEIQQVGRNTQVDKNVELPNDRFLPEVRHVLQEGHTATIRVKGISMRPFLENGRDKVMLESFQQLHINDAALAEISPGHFVLHRVIAIDGTHVTLMGDGNAVGTEACELENVAGIVRVFIRNGKAISSNSRQWKIYSSIWPKLMPVRRYLLFIYRCLM